MLKLFIAFSFLFSLTSTATSTVEVSANALHEVMETGFVNDDNVYINNVDQPVTIEGIILEIRVQDFEDGELTQDIYVIFDNYTPNIAKLGDYVVVFGVTDSGGIESTIAITVKNVDVTNPTFTVEVASTLNIPQYSLLSSNLPNITAYDSFEGNLTADVEITGLELIDTDVLGEYSLIYTVSDSTGNQTTETFIVKVVDSTKPVLSGPEEIIKRSDTILDGTFYLQYFSASDDHDGIVTNRIEVISDEYIGNANNPGTYHVVVSVKDIQGNFTNHNLTIKVVKDMLPRLIIDKYYWVVANDHKVIDSEFIEVLKKIDDLPNYTYIFTTTYDNYTNAYTDLDIYQKDFSLLSSTGVEFEREVILEIVDSGANLVDESPGFIENNSGVILGIVATVVVVGLFVVGIKKS